MHDNWPGPARLEEARLYKNIVLAYDASPDGRAALREGALLARAVGAKAFLLAVGTNTPGMWVMMASQAYSGANIEAFERSILEEGRNSLRALGVDHEAALVRGEPALEIAAYAKAVRADLVVVALRKQNLLQRWWSGSSGAYLSDHLDCSLLIARNTAA
jgi:nucleotide-binding universal stress UspA family protein